MSIRLLIITCLLFTAISGTSQRPFSDKISLFEAINDVHIRAMIQDERGYMWLGTELGVCKFTGQGLFPIHDTIHRAVTALYNDHGTIYAGYENGMFGRIEGDTMKFINIRNAAPKTAIRNLIATTSSAFLCTEKGLYVVMANSGILLDKKDGLADNSAISIVKANDGKFLIGTNNGISELYVNNNKVSVNTPDLQKLPGKCIKVLKRSVEDNYMWVGTDQGIAHIHSKQRHQQTTYKGKWTWGSVTDILPLSERNIWVSTSNGYLLELTIDADSFKIKPYVFGENIYTQLLYNNSGNIWCATANGLTVLSIDFALTTHISPLFDITKLTAMACDKQDRLWLAQEKSIYTTKLPGDSIVPKLAGVLQSNIKCLHIDNNNELWIGTESSGIWHKTANSPFTKIQTGSQLGSKIFSINSNSSGHLLIADGKGVKEIEVWGTEAKVIKTFDRQKGLSGNNVSYIYKDSKENMWLATNNGLCMYDGKKYHHWDSVSGITSKYIVTITEDAYGNIWAGSSDNGVYRYSKGKWKHLAKVNGLQDLNISTIAANKTGQVVLVHGKGVDEWYPQSVQFRRFNKRTIPAIDSTIMALNCSAIDSKGNVYIPTETGLIIYINTPRQLVIKPAIYINKVGIFLKPVKTGINEFSHDQHHVSFQYEGINFANIEQMYYRFFLEGYSDEWTFSTNETISFPHLTPGKYKFRLQASLDKDFEEASEVTYDFTITPPFWLRPWFMLVAIMMIVGCIYLYVKFREKRLRKVAQLKQEKTLFEYEHLKSQVNPHFLFNSLNTLTYLIEEDQEHAIDYTVELSALYRNILTYRNKDTILLWEECKLLSSYMHVQKRRFRNGLNLESNIPEKVLQEYKIIPLALQLLIENAIKHNAVSTTEPLTIYISVDENNMLVVRNRIVPKVSKEKGAGLALINIQKRYRLMTRKAVSYGEVNGEYIVKIPLL